MAEQAGEAGGAGAPAAPARSPASRDAVVLRTQGLVKRFGGLVAVQGVSLDVRAGEILGVVGPNGAGKTVLISCIAGALPPNEGRVWLWGHDTTWWNPERKCRLGLARTFQIPQPFPRLSVLENVLIAAQFGAPRDRRRDPRSAARDCLAFVEFRRPEATLAGALNTVELKRLDLARALASQPRLLLLDELAAGLMTGQLADLMAIIRRIRDGGVTIVMIEHIMPTILGLCDRLAVLHYGRLIAEGPTGEVARDPRVIEAYLGEAHAGHA